LQFLAACRAIVDKDAAAHIPIQRDATASGFQHFAAMARDEVAAPFVNLVDGERPCALYAEVAIRVAAKLSALDPSPARDVSLELLGKAGKALCKQPVMTTPYGVTLHGARQQVRVVMTEHGVTGDVARDARRLVADTIIGVVHEMFPRVVSAMDWVQACAMTIAKANRPVMWRTPLGWPVVQPYYKTGRIEVHTPFGRLILTADRPGMPVNMRKQASGSRPNFVHGVDGALIMRTATECQNRGIDFLGVHDACWSHAAHTEIAGDVYRRQFARLHAVPLLRDLWHQWREQHPDIELPPPPPPGTYDPHDIINAVYAAC
jgi:DNA-directed RNA polymerase